MATNCIFLYLILAAQLRSGGDGLCLVFTPAELRGHGGGESIKPSSRRRPTNQPINGPRMDVVGVFACRQPEIQKSFTNRLAEKIRVANKLFSTVTFFNFQVY